MDDAFLIWIDRLKGGATQHIAESLDPTFLDIHEKELFFGSPVVVQGKAYLSEEQLVIHLQASTEAKMPCSICNQMTQITIKVENFTHTQPLEEISSAVFNYQETVREALLLELPQFLECNGGKCPQRPSLSPFLRSGQRTENFPFKDLH